MQDTSPPNVTIHKQALTRKGVRAEYSVSERTVARWEKRGLRFSKLMRTRLYLRTDIEEFIRNSR